MEPATDPKRREPVRPWPGLIFALYGFMALVTFDQIEEDAFIYFRVAANIANGHGYVFNAGGEHVETGSSLAWQCLLALGSLLSIDLLFLSKLLGLVLGGATLYVVLLVSRRIINHEFLRTVPAFLLAFSIPFYGWVQRGLETPLYLFSIVLLAFCLLEERPRRYWYLPALLVGLSRSEGLIVALGLSGFLYFERSRIRRHAGGALAFAALVIGVTAWRFYYFHDLAPHAFYLKIQEPPGLARESVLLFFWATGLWILLGAAAIGLFERRVWDRPLVTLAVLELPFLWWAFGTHALTQNNRHLVPALPLFYVVVGRGLDALVERRAALSRPVVWGSGAFLVWFALGAPAFDLSIRRAPNLFSQALRKTADTPPSLLLSNLGDLVVARPRALVVEDHIMSDAITENWQFLVGDFIARTYPQGITIAYDQMGQTPWYAGLDKNVIDTAGLTYRATAFPSFNETLEQRSSVYLSYREWSERLLGVFGSQPYRRWTRTQAVDHVFELEPHLIILNSIHVFKTHPDGAIETVSSHVPGLIAQDGRLKQRYVERKKWFLRFYERNDLSATIDWSKENPDSPAKADKMIVRVVDE